MNVLMLREERLAVAFVLDSLAIAQENIPPAMFRTFFDRAAVQGLNDLNEALRMACGGNLDNLEVPGHMLIGLPDNAAEQYVRFVKSGKHMPQVGECACGNTDPECQIKWIHHLADKIIDLRAEQFKADKLIDEILGEEKE
jgi:hypothetical protein